MGVRMLWRALLASVVVAAVAAGSASAATVSSQQLGINISHNQWPADLTGGWPGSAGVGVARVEVIKASSWSATDTLVTKLWQAGMRLAPFLGLPCPSSQSCTPQYSEQASQAATDMANYVTAFAQRYGPGGSFWAGKTNPLPVEQYEIGDESNIPVQWVQDDTHLHWYQPSSLSTCQSSDPQWAAEYAQVYVASEQALHNLHLPGVEAVVGGLGDSGSLCVTLTQDEEILSAIEANQTPDAVAFHPYTWQTNGDFAPMQSDVAALRQWMNANGMASTQIEINEFDACASPGPPGTGQCTPPQPVVTSDWWGAFVASYTTWALCTPGLGVQSVAPFTWGDTSETTHFQLLVDSNGAITAYGQDYLNTVKALETTGCPPPSSIPPVVLPPGSTGSTGGSPPGVAPGRPTARLHILHVHVYGSYVTIEVQVSYGNHSIKVVAVKGHHRIRFHVVKRKHWRTLLWLTAKLFHGKWTINVTCVPPSGYAVPPARHHTVKIAR